MFGKQSTDWSYERPLCHAIASRNRKERKWNKKKEKATRAQTQTQPQLGQRPQYNQSKINSIDLYRNISSKEKPGSLQSCNKML